MIPCPHCGQPMPPVTIKGLTLNRAERTVSYGGKTARLRPKHMEFFLAVLDAWPDVATTDQIRERMYPNKAERIDIQRKGLNVFACDVNNEFRYAGIPLLIENVRGVGKQLSVPSEAVAVTHELNKQREAA